MSEQIKERPILFSAPMVRALLAGTKTQTRRIVSPRHLEFFARAASEQVANWYKRPLPYGGEINCDAAEAFAVLWDSINGAGSWGENPWVRAITFTRVRP